MKVIKAEDVLEAPQNGKSKDPQIDKEKVAKLQEKFDSFRQLLDKKTYEILLNEEQTEFFFEVFFNTVEWKGYESYAVSETYDKLRTLVNENGELKGKANPEIVEAIFHFLKNHTSNGIAEARIFRGICDQFSLPMKELNEDRQELRDLSLEVVAAEQGIEVEELVKRMNSQQN
jgi:hypothetical protein